MNESESSKKMEPPLPIGGQLQFRLDYRTVFRDGILSTTFYLGFTSMEITQSRRHMVYALVSFACPVVALLIMLGYQSVAHAEDWRRIDAEVEQSMEGAFLFLGEIILCAYAILLGTLVGIVFAILSLRLKPRVLSLGTAAIVFNSLPFAAVLAFIVRGMTRGF